MAQLERDTREVRGLDAEAVLDLVVAVPSDVTAVAADLSDRLDELDGYCREGRHLLTVPAADDVLSYRRWLLTEYERRSDKQEAAPWSATGRTVVDLPIL